VAGSGFADTLISADIAGCCDPVADLLRFKLLIVNVVADVAGFQTLYINIYLRTANPPNQLLCIF
jgi:hypothetical protein